MWTGRRRVIALTVVAIVLAAVAAAAFLFLPPPQTGQVAMPGAQATPEQVVQAYIGALNAYDCGTAAAIWTGQTSESWCNDVAHLRDVAIGGHRLEPASASGRSADEEVASVPVSFNLDWRPLHGDGSLQEGPTSWGYLLVRDSLRGPWRIFAEGTG